MSKKETGIRGEAKGMPLTIKGRRVTKDYLIEHGIINDYFSPIEKEDDSISRQAAIDSIQYAGKIGKQTCISILKRLPTAQPEVLACGSGELNAQSERTGRWEQVEINYFADMDEEIQEAMAIASMFCPMCKRYHNEVYLYGDATYGVNFCPNCGADMRGKQDDSV